MATQSGIETVEGQVLRRVRTHGAGWCFTPNAFLDLAEKGTIWVTLARLAKEGRIRRLARGLYDYPRRHAKLGTLAPDPESVAVALAERDATRLQPSGAFAANLLGLSEHVPATVVFLTDGHPRRVRVGTREIVLKRAAPRTMATAGRVSGTVIQALRFLGKERVDGTHVQRLQAILSVADKAQLRRDRGFSPAWMHPLIDAITDKTDA